MPVPRFEQLVFSGGGTRCFWQGGFLDVVRRAIDLDPARIASVSGGALGSAAYVAHRGNALLRIMADAFRSADQNVRWDDATSEGGLTPHQRIYRQVAEETLTPEAVEAVAEGPVLEILIGHPPADSRSRWAGMAATALYEAELHLVGSPHFGWAQKFGLEATMVDARQAARDGRLIDLCCAAATIPPLFEIHEWDGRPVVDGGMADQAPVPTDDEGETLILLTRDYDKVPDHPQRTYLSPSKETPADKIDFTDPDKIERTWEVGQRDGVRYLEKHGLKRTEGGTEWHE